MLLLGSGTVVVVGRHETSRQKEGAVGCCKSLMREGCYRSRQGGMEAH